jgi:guanosine-3',5'-bis(diphosphate) 3'-pyrophosphohydrolase
VNLAYEAMIFAREVHKDQRRKYTNNPYTDHLAEVAGIAVTACPERLRPEMMVAVAWLHDCMEDQGVTLETLEQKFGSTIAYAVSQLSDMETGNRAARKAASRERLSRAWDWVQTIKCADLISNTSSIVMHDPKFAEVYLEEKRLLLDALTQADPRLLAIARGQATVAGVQGTLKGQPK